MVIDFHVHGKIKCTYPFDQDKFLETVQEAKEGGLDSLALTEHCHAENFFEGYNFLKANYEQIDDYFDVDGFKVFYGMEITTQQSIDIVMIGNPKLIIELREKVLQQLKDEKYIDINTLFTIPIIKELLVILAHPYRKYSEFPTLHHEVIEKINAVEFNAKDLYKNGIEETKRKVTELAKKFHLPIVCGSDTHYFIQIASVKNILPKDCTTVKEIKEEIQKGNNRIAISSELPIRVKSAIIIKKLICG